MAKRSKQADPAERTNELLRKMTIIQLGLAGGRPSPNQGDRRRRDGGYHDYRSIAEIRPSWKGMEMSDDDATGGAPEAGRQQRQVGGDLAGSLHVLRADFRSAEGGHPFVAPGGSAPRHQGVEDPAEEVTADQRGC